MQSEINVSKTKKRNVGNFVKCLANTKTQKAEKAVRIGVLGASGYTGAEVECLTYQPFWLHFCCCCNSLGYRFIMIFLLDISLIYILNLFSIGLSFWTGDNLT